MIWRTRTTQHPATGGKIGLGNKLNMIFKPEGGRRALREVCRRTIRDANAPSVI